MGRMRKRTRVDCKGNKGAGGGYKSSCVTEGKGGASLQAVNHANHCLECGCRKVNVKNEYGQTSRTGGIFSCSAFLLQKK